MRPQWIGMLCLLVVSHALAQTSLVPAPVDNTAEYQRIDAERTKAMAGFDAEDAQCYQRFAVSGCLKQVQSKRRAVLGELRRQETDLHEAELAQHAVEQRQRAAQKQLERQQQEAELRAENGTARAAEKLREQEEKQASHAAIAAAPAASAAAKPSPTGPSASEQAANRDSYVRKQLEAEKKRQELARRQAEKTSKPAAPLPIPK